MDPITAGLQLGNTIAGIVKDVLEFAPEDVKKQYCGDILKTLHNCSLLIQDAQAKINGALGVKQ